MKSAARPFLLPSSPDAPFPLAELALSDPDGLLAIGGDLSPQRLLNAYRHGIFPWYSQGQPILWWSPDPRMVFLTDRVPLSSRLRRSLRQRGHWRMAADTAFPEVISACATVPRPGQDGTWITASMEQAYLRLHQLGHAHSVEVFAGNELIGGIYGVAVGQMFFGESMFGTVSGASKVALAALALRLHQWGWPLLDAQVENPHLLSLGGQRWPRARFLQIVDQQAELQGHVGSWTSRFGSLCAPDLGAGATLPSPNAL